jgi:signal transduction histidine kinase
MLSTLNWVARGLGFAWVGVVAFVLIPPHGTLNLAVQITGYCLAGAAALAWVLMDTHPAAARYRDRWLAVTLGVMAVAAGFVCAAGSGGTLLVVFAFIAALLAQRERLQAEQRRADLLEERARIAREIHDVLAHSLGALGIQIQAARAVLTDHADTDKACEILVAAQRLAAEGLVETRRAVRAMRADTLPLVEELALVSDTYAQRYHVAVSFDTGGVPGPLPPDATIALLRIAQEALVNAAKHAVGQGVAVADRHAGTTPAAERDY